MTIRAGAAKVAFALFIISRQVSMSTLTYCLSSPGLAEVELLTYTELLEASPGLTD